MTQTLNAAITFISAGAGSGKTHRLTEILHRELSNQQVRSSGIIATTFTKKAAAELRERVRGHLLGQGDFALANTMGQARIGTVNSVCGQLIERFAFEAGMATDQQVLDESQASDLLHKAIDAVLGRASMAALLSLTRRLGLEDDWKSALEELVKQIRTNDITLDKLVGFATNNAQDLLSYFPKATKHDLSAQLHEAIKTVLPAIEQVASTGGKKNTKDYLNQLRHFDHALSKGESHWGDWVKLSKSFPETALKPEVEPIASIAGRVAEHAGLHTDINQYLQQIFELAAKVLAVYAESKRELGVLDFADQEHQLLKLLDHPSVVEVLTDELDLLMVDEFQDTSPIQLTLFLKLAGFAKQVYWVGDIKQAIYGFRGSDTQLMQAILEALPELGGNKEVLSSSWRSREELVRVINSVFGEAFSNTLPSTEVELQPTRKDQLPDASLINWILVGKNAGQENTALASGIRQLIDSGYQVLDKGQTATRQVRLGDIAILSRSNDGVKAIATALRMQGIPSATAQPGLLCTPEAVLAMACLRRLNDPSDTIATAEIVSLADGAEPEQWLVDRLRYLQAGGASDQWLAIDNDQQNAHPLVAHLSELRANLPLLAPREALQTVIATCDVPAKIVCWSLEANKTRQRLANLEALLNLASQYEDMCESGQHAASISGLILWFGEMANEGKDMLAEPAIDAVKVMTHHAAKGLEWPVVILTDLSANIKDRLWSITAQPSASFNVDSPLDGRFIRYWPWPFGAQKKVALADTIALTPIAQAFRNSAIEESKRLLYVSMTRARDLLVLVRSSRKLTGEWLDSVEAPWLLQGEGQQEITLPNGDAIKSERWSLDSVDDPADCLNQSTAPLYWFTSDKFSSQPLPLNFSPSSGQPLACSILEKCLIGERMPVKSGSDMTQLGNAIHACLALSFTDLKQVVEINEVERILQGFGVADCITATSIVNQTQALHDWIAKRWPEANPIAEYPVQQILESGQVLNGRLDLILDTHEGWILIDHKSSQLAPENWGNLALEYGSQLAAYRTAIETASNQPVLQSWIFLPVAGGAIQLERPDIYS
ncbi:MAG: UvrD-helicase domain-containing protein [Methylococcaceae bacterium]|nr:UvrD-helicase domain-containing protein [Methylococcaceae bacterium]